MAKLADYVAMLLQLPQDAEVVRPSIDHSYRRLSGPYEADAELNGDDYFEYFNDENMFDESSKKVTVVVIE